MEDIRLNQFLSQIGFCSRRKADEYIKAGRIVVNGTPAILGQKVNCQDNIKFDQSDIVVHSKETENAPVYLAMNKPIGIICTTKDDIHQSGRNIVDYIQFKKRIYPVGRLDKDSCGLIFLTNDGTFTYHLTRAGDHCKKEYDVKVRDAITPQFLEHMRAGVWLEEKKTNPCTVVSMGTHRFKIVLNQGMNRQIRRMVSSLGNEVIFLKRTKIGVVSLGSLKEGEWRYLTANEVNGLLSECTKCTSQK